MGGRLHFFAQISRPTSDPPQIRSKSSKIHVFCQKFHKIVHIWGETALFCTKFNSHLITPQNSRKLSKMPVFCSEFSEKCYIRGTGVFFLQFFIDHLIHHLILEKFQKITQFVRKFDEICIYGTHMHHFLQFSPATTLPRAKRPNFWCLSMLITVFHLN